MYQAGNLNDHLPHHPSPREMWNSNSQKSTDITITRPCTVTIVYGWKNILSKSLVIWWSFKWHLSKFFDLILAYINFHYVIYIGGIIIETFQFIKSYLFNKH